MLRTRRGPHHQHHVDGGPHPRRLRHATSRSSPTPRARRRSTRSRSGWCTTSRTPASRSTCSRPSCSPNRSSTTSPAPGSTSSSAAWRPWARSARRSLGSPTSHSSFRGQYLENHDLEALGFLEHLTVQWGRRSSFDNARRARVSLRPWPSNAFPIEAGHVLMFARAIGDPNPIYADADVAGRSRGRRDPRPADVRAPPARSSTPTTRSGRSPGEPWFGSGRKATGAHADRAVGRRAEAAADVAARRAALRVPPPAGGRRRAPRAWPQGRARGRSRAARAR